MVKDIHELADVGLDLIVDFAGFRTRTAGAIETVKPGGRVVLDRGEIEPVVEEITWDGIADGIDRLERSEVRGRLVALFE